MKGEGFLPPRGNYRALKSFRKAEIVYDITYRFCGRFLQRGDRTIDQMVQAARSGKQNIVEGSPSTGSGQADGTLRCWESDVARSAEMVSALALARSEAEGG